MLVYKKDLSVKIAVCDALNPHHHQSDEEEMFGIFIINRLDMNFLSKNSLMDTRVDTM